MEKLNSVLILSLFSLLPSSMFAAPAQNQVAQEKQADSLAKNSSATGQTIFVWSTPQSTTELQTSLLGKLDKQTGGGHKVPDAPGEDLLGWQMRRWAEVKVGDAIAVSTTLWGDLALSRQLLTDKNADMRRRGLRLAHSAVRLAGERGAKAQTIARVFDAWILPFIADARTQSWRDLSRIELLKDGAIAFRGAADGERSIAALELLLREAEGVRDVTASDWARINLANAFTRAGRFREAAALLETRAAEQEAANKAAASTAPIAAPAPQAKPQIH
jgi:hypothetical protein